MFAPGGIPQKYPERFECFFHLLSECQGRLKGYPHLENRSKTSIYGDLVRTSCLCGNGKSANYLANLSIALEFRWFVQVEGSEGGKLVMLLGKSVGTPAHW